MDYKRETEMKITKTQLKQIIKEELEKTINEALAGGIDEFAKDLGMKPLPHGFTDQQLVDFTYAVLEATESQAPGMTPFSGPRHVPMKHGQTHKQSREKYDKAGLGQRQVEWHPLTSTTAPDRSGEEVPVGKALEKLIQKRHMKSPVDSEIRKQLWDARMALLNAVDPSGRLAQRAQRAAERSASRKANPRAWARAYTQE
jgi:hypothetical protein